MPKVVPKTLDEIRAFIDGELDGRKDLVIDSLATSPDSSTSDDLLLIFEEKYLKNIQELKAKALVVSCDLKEKFSETKLPKIWVKRPRLVLKKLLNLFSKLKSFPKAGIHEKAIVDLSSKISKTACIGANVYIGANCIVGENTIIYPNCTILDNSQIGNNVILHPGVVIGSDGYSYVTEEESNLEKAKKGNFNFNLGRQIQHKISSIGNVIIEDDVEIGANSCVDAGTIGSTIIGAGTKIDNLVQIAHNCKIGKDCLIVGQVGFAGSVQTGDRIIVGGQTGFADNINIGSDVIFVARSAVHGDIPSNSIYIGMPAVPYKEYFKNEKEMKRLPRKFENLEARLKSLEEKLRIGV
ncbi:MAG: UDP-3-O-(3-hydroxymyristoyl)glucosamine N-acyltransferase [Candidatus Melainabacteria bacterium]|nr:UDP-3-O-(3-hydroxymyristoyl)glucosamine N-acyltransferase [Candidatus Melainabacteria bacterium]